MLFSGNKSLSDMIVAFLISCRSGKDPAWFFQEELQGPLEATTHADEGGEGQVKPLLAHRRQTHRTARDWLTRPALFLFVCSSGFHVQPMQRGGNYSCGLENDCISCSHSDFIATKEFHKKKGYQCILTEIYSKSYLIHTCNWKQQYAQIFCQQSFFKRRLSDVNIQALTSFVPARCFKATFLLRWIWILLLMFTQLQRSL